MKKIKILYLPDVGKDEYSSFNDVARWLDEVYGESSTQVMLLDFMHPDRVLRQIRKAVDAESPDILLAKGLACLFAHQTAGVKRLCLEPVLTVDEQQETQLPEATIMEYHNIEQMQYRYDRLLDTERSTECFSILTSASEGYYRYKSLYPMQIRYWHEIKMTEKTVKEDLVEYINGVIENKMYPTY